MSPWICAPTFQHGIEISRLYKETEYFFFPPLWLSVSKTLPAQLVFAILGGQSCNTVRQGVQISHDGLISKLLSIFRCICHDFAHNINTVQNTTK